MECHILPFSSLDSGSQFICTKLFNELEKDFNKYKAGTGCTLMCLLGPKGVGKTAAMVQLMRDHNNDNDMFIDLGSISPTEVITVKPNCSTLFIDNAQLYDRATLAPNCGCSFLFRKMWSYSSCLD